MDDLHTEEFKVRLTPRDAALLRALAGKRDLPPAVLVRTIVVAALDCQGHSVPTAQEMRSPT